MLCAGFNLILSKTDWFCIPTRNADSLDANGLPDDGHCHSYLLVCRLLGTLISELLFSYKLVQFGLEMGSGELNFIPRLCTCKKRTRFNIYKASSVLTVLR